MQERLQMILTKSILNQHVKCIHEEVAKFKCTFCDKVFSQEANLQVHTMNRINARIVTDDLVMHTSYNNKVHSEDSLKFITADCIFFKQLRTSGFIREKV